jgi:hypothetical protein
MISVTTFYPLPQPTRQAFVSFHHTHALARTHVGIVVYHIQIINVIRIFCQTSVIIQVWNKTGSGIPAAQVCHLSVRPIPAVPVLLFGLRLPRTRFLPGGPRQVHKGLLSAILDRSWWYRGRLWDRQCCRHRLHNGGGPGTTKGCQRNVYVSRSVDQSPLFVFGMRGVVFTTKCADRKCRDQLNYAETQ